MTTGEGTIAEEASDKPAPKPQASLHDIVSGLNGARLYAGFMAEQGPHHASTLQTFDKEIEQLGARLIKQLWKEGLYGREPKEWPPID
jgi:hypothetical protein